MLDKAIIFLVVFFVAILQIALFSNLFFLGVGPNMMLLLIIFWTVHEGFESALPRIILAGLVLDLVSFYPIGLSVMIFSLISFFGNSFSKRFLVTARNWRIVVLALLVFFSTLINEICSVGLFELFAYFKEGEINNIISSTNGMLFMKEVLLNIAFFFLISFPLMKIEKLLNLRKNKKKLSYV